MSGVRQPALAALAALALAAGFGLVLAVAGGRVQGARVAAAEAEARMAAALWEEEGGGAQAVAGLLGERATIVGAGAGGAGAGAHAYEAGALDPAAWIAVAPHRASGPWTAFPAIATAIALVGMALISGWAAARRRGPTWTRYPAGIALISVGCIALTVVAAERWANRELRSLSAATVAQGARAVELAMATGADPARAARVAHLPWTEDRSLESANQQWTMPAAVAAAIAAAPERGVATPPAPRRRHPVRGGSGRRHLPRGPRRRRPPRLPRIRAHRRARRPAGRRGRARRPAGGAGPPPRAARGPPRALRRTLAAWGLLAPAAVLILAFTLGPLLFSLWISLHEWRLIDPAPLFLGLDNYAALLSNRDWWSAIGNTALFTLHVPAAMAVALALALLTRGSRRALRWARLALFLPAITSVAAIAVVWKWLLSDQYGLVNQVLRRAGLEAVPWLNSPDTALISLMMIGIWMVVGYQMVVFQAGLAAIPRDWYDAARVDGAGPWQRFRHITLPGLRHTLFFVLVTSVIGSFQVFGLVYVMTEGGPLGATDVAVYHIYREAWEFLRFGNAAAMSWMLFAVVFAATWLHFRFLETRRVHA